MSKKITNPTVADANEVIAQANEQAQVAELEQPAEVAELAEPTEAQLAEAQADIDILNACDAEQKLYGGSDEEYYGDEEDTDEEEVTLLDKSIATAVTNAIAAIKADLTAKRQTVETMVAANASFLTPELLQTIRNNMLLAQGLTDDADADLANRLHETKFSMPKSEVVLGTLAELERSAQLSLESHTNILMSGSPYMQAVNASPEALKVKALLAELDTAKKAVVDNVFIPAVIEKFSIKNYNLQWSSGGNILATTTKQRSPGTRQPKADGSIQQRIVNRHIAPNLKAEATYGADNGKTPLKFTIQSDNERFTYRCYKVNGNGQSDSLEFETQGLLDLRKIDGKPTPATVTDQLLKKYSPNSRVSMHKLWAAIPGGNGIYAD
jgi:hypothetical protein